MDLVLLDLLRTSSSKERLRDGSDTVSTTATKAAAIVLADVDAVLRERGLI
jgi:hypothetical protein